MASTQPTPHAAQGVQRPNADACNRMVNQAYKAASSAMVNPLCLQGFTPYAARPA